jgi:hypothetical protein
LSSLSLLLIFLLREITRRSRRFIPTKIAHSSVVEFRTAELFINSKPKPILMAEVLGGLCQGNLGDANYSFPTVPSNTNFEMEGNCK